MILLLLGLAAVLVGSLAATLAIEAHARDLTVTNSHDAGPRSSRQTISLSLTYPATITLTTGELGIAKLLNHSRPGARRISGEDASVATLRNAAARHALCYRRLMKSTP